VVVFPYFCGAQLEYGLSPRLAGRHPRPQVLLGLERKIFGNLLPAGARQPDASLRNSTGASRIFEAVSCQVFRFNFEKACDDCRRLLPIAGLCLQLLAAGCGKPIEPGSAVVF
jgi:hypothetical protein